MLTRRRRAAHGFTLIELMVTITMLAFLLAAVAPSVLEWIRNTRIRNSATSIQAGLMKARQEAVRRNQNIRFSLVSLTDAAVMDSSCALSATGISWVVSVNDPAGKCDQAVSETTDPMIVEKSAGGVGGTTISIGGRLADDSAAATSVTFNGFGRVVGASPLGLIKVQDASSVTAYRTLHIAIGSGGTIRMCDPKVTDTSDPRKC
jgi:type IV fimbrial biogenesis protein FimT